LPGPTFARSFFPQRPSWLVTAKNSLWASAFFDLYHFIIVYKEIQDQGGFQKTLGFIQFKNTDIAEVQGNLLTNMTMKNTIKIL
jgi:hypothetical protein